MKQQRKNPALCRRKLVVVRLTAEEEMLYRQKALSAGLKLSSWIRERLKETP